jgi:hypothetical protein
MGLISGLLTLPLAPVRGVAWVGEQLAIEGERQMNDERRIRRELAQLEHDFEEGRIPEAEFEELEDQLLERLARAREWEGVRNGVQ